MVLDALAENLLPEQKIKNIIETYPIMADDRFTTLWADHFFVT